MNDFGADSGSLDGALAGPHRPPAQLDSAVANTFATPVSPARSSVGDAPKVVLSDADSPCGVAFIRSLGRAGLPVDVAGPSKWSVGRASWLSTDSREWPSAFAVDELTDVLASELDNGATDLVAPTSDFAVYCVSEADDRLGLRKRGRPSPRAVRDCLFKHHFADAMEAAGFPTPATALPTDLESALEAADRIGYPVILKPRSHIGVGYARGVTVRSEDELVAMFGPYEIQPGQSSVLRHDPEIVWPMVQEYHDADTVDVVSLSGCLGADGEVLALSHIHKVAQSPRRFGVGTMFEPLPPQPFTKQAVEAVRRVLGVGLFELEVLVDRSTGEYWAIDLNPRGFGQISMDIALGNDLPVLWYRTVSGVDLSSGTRPRRRRPMYWSDGVTAALQFTERIVRGPERAATARGLLRRLTSPGVGAFSDWRDPMPALASVFHRLRHPRSLVRRIVHDTEIADHHIHARKTTAVDRSAHFFGRPADGPE